MAVTYYDFRNNDAKPGLPTDYWAVFGKPTTPTALTNPANWGNELRLTDRSFDLEKALFQGEGDTPAHNLVAPEQGDRRAGRDPQSQERSHARPPPSFVQRPGSAAGSRGHGAEAR